MNLNFENRYGRLSLALVMAIRPIRGIRGADIEQQHKFNLDTAEMVALITDNRGVQICPTRDDNGKWAYYVIAHNSPDTGAVARIASIDYLGKNPAQEIRDARRADPQL